MQRTTMLLLVLAFLGTVAAQSRIDSSSATYEKPGQAYYTDSHCLEYQVKSLYAATDLNLALDEQDKLLNAAEAYGQLWELQQPC